MRKFKCSGCKAWNRKGHCDLGYEQKVDRFYGTAPLVGDCPKPKYVFEYKKLMEERNLLVAGTAGS